MIDNGLHCGGEQENGHKRAPKGSLHAALDHDILVQRRHLSRGVCIRCASCLRCARQIPSSQRSPDPGELAARYATSKVATCPQGSHSRSLSSKCLVPQSHIRPRTPTSTLWTCASQSTEPAINGPSSSSCRFRYGGRRRASNAMGSHSQPVTSCEGIYRQVQPASVVCSYGRRLYVLSWVTLPHAGFLLLYLLFFLCDAVTATPLRGEVLRIGSAHRVVSSGLLDVPLEGKLVCACADIWVLGLASHTELWPGGSPTSFDGPSDQSLGRLKRAR